MNTHDVFKSQKTAALDVLTKLRAFLEEGERLGVNIDPKLKSKLQVALQDAHDGKLHAALIGGFSEGKTSIAAAWLERIDPASMKIKPEESSDSVAIYEVEDDLKLIDTPGLFGFNETKNKEKYRDITRKYVSEAQLILYVMDPVNPIKASHEEELKWLFRTLNLLARTVFVLGRFDAVADVADEPEYASQLAIKRCNVVERLHDIIALTEKERGELAIVAVSANPFDKGVAYWLEHLDEFRGLSHISELQQATNEIVKKNGGFENIVFDTKRSIIRDILNIEIPIAKAKDDKISQELLRLEDVNERVSAELISIEAKMNSARIHLRTSVSNYFADLILMANGTSMETYDEFFEHEVGDSGIRIETKIRNMFDEQIENANVEIKKMGESYNTEISHFMETVSGLGKQGINFLLKSKIISGGNILAARNILNIGIKFKPWGAIKLAKGMSSGFAVFGVGIELWEMWDNNQKEQKFEEVRAKAVANFEEQRRELLALINEDSFPEKFFPVYGELKQQTEVIQNELTTLREKQRQFHKWKEKCEIIDAEFTEIKEESQSHKS